MFKYSVKCFDNDDVLVFSAVIPADQLFSFVDEFKSKYSVKAYLINVED